MLGNLYNTATAENHGMHGHTRKRYCDDGAEPMPVNKRGYALGSGTAALV
jgi:hypothetical protein